MLAPAGGEGERRGCSLWLGRRWLVRGEGGRTRRLAFFCLWLLALLVSAATAGTGDGVERCEWAGLCAPLLLWWCLWWCLCLCLCLCFFLSLLSF